MGCEIRSGIYFANTDRQYLLILGCRPHITSESGVTQNQSNKDNMMESGILQTSTRIYTHTYGGPVRGRAVYTTI